MSSILSLNEYHSESITALLGFFRSQNLQRIKSIEGCFDDISATSLKGSVFTIDEVNNILNNLQEQIKIEAELEFINASHTAILLLTQLFQQAERWHLRLAPDIGELENRALLDKIKAFESSFNTLSGQSKLKVDPLSGDRAANLLQREIARLQTENADLREKISGNRLEIDKQSIQDAEIKRLKSELEELKASHRNSFDSAELAKVQAMLKVSQSELEKRVNETIPFQNLKQILLRKNEQLKEIRKQISDMEKP
ncbi:Leucine zipper transcription factor-like protein 1 [Cichlidogyrus casuarinus]|uniref:Leucine zipper transcription factor-like protein 1 n=1 Tax=Cichlidogyrus casuarinus TaxID=1844966 RepID=A0ABD2Q1G6_9PLAT